MGQLLPVIKNFAWFIDDALVLKEPLLDFDESPVMGIAEDLDDKIKYSEASSPEAYATELAARKTEALENLKNLEITYDVQEVNGEKVIVASGQEFASEKILDTSFLAKIHQELGSEQVAIGIPFQGFLIAISNGSAELLNKFPSVIKKHYDNPQADKISDRVFLSVNASIVAHAGVDANAQKAAVPEPCFVQTMTQDLLELRATFNKTYQELLIKCSAEEAISGILKFMIIPEIIQKSDGLINLCLELASSFSDVETVSSAAPTLTHLKVVFSYDQDDILAEQSYTI
ncbi:MAG: hypothetical protein NTW54_08870 [Bacteroidetes bacterium]|nr:hypothetical protein [Bacteroidota bacterium]